MAYRENAYRGPPGPSWWYRHRERVLFWSLLATIVVSSCVLLLSSASYFEEDPPHRVHEPKTRVARARRVLQQAPSEVVRPPYDAEVAFLDGFEGKSFSELFREIEKHDDLYRRLKDLVGIDIEKIRAFRIGVPTIKVDDAIEGKVCEYASECGWAQAILVIDLVAGTLHCGVVWREHVTVYSETPGDIPAALAKWQADLGHPG